MSYPSRHEGKSSKIPKPCPVCGRNAWRREQTFRDKHGRVHVLSWTCPCGFTRPGKTNRGINVPKPWEHKSMGIVTSTKKLLRKLKTKREAKT